MEILLFEQIESTHLFLEEALKKGELKAPVLITANRQTGGVGSRGNRWDSIEGNLFLSFALSKDSLPSDLLLQTSSIYFSFLMKETLAGFGSKVWLKWPNDFYIDDKKIGGTITKLLDNKTLICSMGINLKNAPEDFGILDINIDKMKLIDSYNLKLKEHIKWKKIFSQYCVEFEKSRGFCFHDMESGERTSMDVALLNEDGSITINNKKVYSLR